MTNPVSTDNQNQAPASQETTPPSVPPATPTPPAPSTPPADPAPATPQRLPDDHPLVTAFEAQKTKNTALQAQIDQIPATVATALRGHLIKVHNIPEATANTLVTGTTPETVIAQIQAVAGLATPAAGGAPLLGTTTHTPPSDAAAFVGQLFGGTDS